ncbi:soyasapogenol B glucuronide galactosyltransferase [Trifolium repens]|nr:soyasapogenol B glucuronide galactosyltransferase [Trifolium repens]
MESQKLHVIFVPFPTPGHMIPMIDTARLFAKHGVNVTIITTHANASTFQKSIDTDFNSGYSIKTQLLQFPSAQVGLPEGVENVKDATSSEILGKISRGIMMLQHQIEVMLHDLQPDCIVSDMTYPWTVESAAKLNIPRIYFYSSSYFSNCASYFVRKYRPHDDLVSDTKKFTIPCLPHTIEMTPLQLSDWIRVKTSATGAFGAMFDSEKRSYGTLYNSFHELESDYETLSKTTMGIKSWSVGPVSAWINNDDERKANRGNIEKNIGKYSELLNWLNSKPNDSVIYVCFGSLTRISHAQIVELAYGLENSGSNFILVVREKDKDEDREDFLHDFEKRVKESKKGYIIWNWAPQLLILDHPSTGGIVTHCGWNSILESLNAGLPMITWPMFAEQFYNEKLLVDVLKIGVSVGSKVNKFWLNIGEEKVPRLNIVEEEVVVKREEIVKAVEILMGSGQEGKTMRTRAKKLSDAAKKTVEEGGHSYNNLIQLIDELKSLKIARELEKSKLDN